LPGENNFVSEAKFNYKGRLSMQNYHFYANQMYRGQIPIPPDILSKLVIKPGFKIKVILEILPEEQEYQLPEKQYNFTYARNITSGIENKMSSEIIADRADRI